MLHTVRLSSSVPWIRKRTFLALKQFECHQYVTYELYDLEAIDFFANKVLNLDRTSGACHDYTIQIY